MIFEEAVNNFEMYFEARKCKIFQYSIVLEIPEEKKIVDKNKSSKVLKINEKEKKKSK